MDMDEATARIRAALKSAAFKKALGKKKTKRLRRIAKTSFEVQVPVLEDEAPVLRDSAVVPDTPPGSLRRRGA